MGVSNTKTKCLKSNELRKYLYKMFDYSLLFIVEFSKVSTFTADEINDLYLFFNQLSKSRRDDGVIDYEEFRLAVNLPDGIYA